MNPMKPNPEAEKYQKYFYISLVCGWAAILIIVILLLHCWHLESRIDYWRNLALQQSEYQK